MQLEYDAVISLVYLYNKTALEFSVILSFKNTCFETGIVIVFHCKDPIVLHEASLEIWTNLTFGWAMNSLENGTN